MNSFQSVGLWRCLDRSLGEGGVSRMEKAKLEIVVGVFVLIGMVCLAYHLTDECSRQRHSPAD